VAFPGCFLLAQQAPTPAPTPTPTQAPTQQAPAPASHGAWALCCQ